jgi:hypothetical protein
MGRTCSCTGHNRRMSKDHERLTETNAESGGGGESLRPGGTNAHLILGQISHFLDPPCRTIIRLTEENQDRRLGQEMERIEMKQKKIGTTLYSSARRGDRAEAFFGSLTCTNCGAELTEAARSCNNCGMPVPEEAAPREAPTPQESVVPPDQPSLPPFPSHPPTQRSAFELRRSLREEGSPQQEEGEVPLALREVVSAQGIGGPSGASLTFSVAQRKRVLLASAIVALLVLASGGGVALAGVGSVGSLLEGSEPPQPVDDAQASDSQEKGDASEEDTEEASYNVSTEEASYNGSGGASVYSPGLGSPTPSEEEAPSVPSYSSPTLSEEEAPSLHPERGYNRPEISGQKTSKDKAGATKSSPVPASEGEDPEEDKTPAGGWAEEAAPKKAPPAATKGQW